jgi:hypothetical protein
VARPSPPPHHRPSPPLTPHNPLPPPPPLPKNTLTSSVPPHLKTDQSTGWAAAPTLETHPHAGPTHTRDPPTRAGPTHTGHPPTHVGPTNAGHPPAKVTAPASPPSLLPLSIRSDTEHRLEPTHHITSPTRRAHTSHHPPAAPTHRPPARRAHTSPTHPPRPQITHARGTRRRSSGPRRSLA